MGNEISQPIPIGNRVVKVQKTLAEGAYGFVDLVEDVKTREKFAMKRILAQDRDTLALARIEVDIFKQLPPHDNIVGFYGTASRDLDHGQKQLFILMEYCPQTLAQVFHHIHHPLSESEVIKFFLPICQGVSHLHAQDPPIAHRDLKLENVLVNSYDEYKLCDFGSCSTVSKIYETQRDIADLEEQVQKFTTSIFRAPEQVDLYSRRHVGVAVDVWALGCILFFLLFREHAFPTAASNQIVCASICIPNKHGYSKKIINLLKNLLTVDSRDRPSIEDVVDALLNMDDHVLLKYLLNSVIEPREDHTSLKSAKHKKDSIKVEKNDAPKSQKSGKSILREENTPKHSKSVSQIPVVDSTTPKHSKSSRSEDCTGILKSSSFNFESEKTLSIKVPPSIKKSETIKIAPKSQPGPKISSSEISLPPAPQRQKSFTPKAEKRVFDRRTSIDWDPFANPELEINIKESRESDVFDPFNTHKKASNSLSVKNDKDSFDPFSSVETPVVTRPSRDSDSFDPFSTSSGNVSNDKASFDPFGFVSPSADDWSNSKLMKNIVEPNCAPLHNINRNKNLAVSVDANISGDKPKFFFAEPDEDWM